MAIRRYKPEQIVNLLRQIEVRIANGELKYEMLRAHSVEEDSVAEVCRQFALSRESFYQIQQAFQELGFGAFLPRKRGRKGPVKLKDEVLEFALAKQKENPELKRGIQPSHVRATSARLLTQSGKRIL